MMRLSEGGMMNLTESLRHVLKHKSQNILTLIIKEDVKNFSFFEKMRKFKRHDFSLKNSVGEFKNSLETTVLLFKVLPKRIKNGFLFFTQDLLKELDLLPDQKKKTIFSLKVLAGISQFALSSAYDLGVGESKLLRIGKSKNLVTNIIISKIMFKTIQAFIIRLVVEMEKEVTDVEELKVLQNFRKMILDDSVNAIDKFFDSMTVPGDQAFTIVENFKKYILTGERVTD